MSETPEVFNLITDENTSEEKVPNTILYVAFLFNVSLKIVGYFDYTLGHHFLNYMAIILDPVYAKSLLFSIWLSSEFHGVLLY